MELAKVDYLNEGGDSEKSMELVEQLVILHLK